MGTLFEAMAEGGEFNLLDIPHFDGGLFSEGGVVPLEASELGVLREATELDRGSVEPAIFEQPTGPGFESGARVSFHYPLGVLGRR